MNGFEMHNFMHDIFPRPRLIATIRVLTASQTNHVRNKTPFSTLFLILFLQQFLVI